MFGYIHLSTNYFQNDKVGFLNLLLLHLVDARYFVVVGGGPERCRMSNTFADFY